MKRNFLLVALAVAGAMLSGDAWSQDVLTVNDENIWLRFENDRVRVLERTLRPGEREKEHSHPAYLIYVVRGGKLRDHSADGKVVEGRNQRWRRSLP